MKNIKYLILFLFINVTYGQSFEGEIIYKTFAENPNPDIISTSYFKETLVTPMFGEVGFAMQKYYYKGPKYMGVKVINAINEFELYSSETKEVYTWEKNSKKGIVSKVNEDPAGDTLLQIIETDETQTILNISCKKIVLEFKKLGKVELWYNSDFLKINKEDYKDFKLEYKDIISQKLGCLPLKAKVGFLVTEVIAFKQQQVSDKLFQIPALEFEANN